MTMASQSSPATARDFASSPAGTEMSATGTPKAASASFARARYRGATVSSVITSSRFAFARAGTPFSFAPRLSRIPSPMRTS